MNSLMFLLLRQSKNRLLELRTKPAKLIIYIAVIAFFGYLLIQGMTTEMPYVPVDNNMFTGIIAGFLAFTFIIAVLTAFSRGASFFEMEDVNYLFVSPMKPRTILLYGVIKAAKTIIIGSWFIIFQVNWMRSSFGVGVGGALIAALGYIMVAFISQIISLNIYALINGRPRRKRIAIAALVAIFVPAIVVFMAALIQGHGVIDALTVLVASPALRFTPIVGWAAAGVSAVLFGEMIVGLLFLGLLALSGVAFFCIIYFGNPDYYEDVLGATETAFEATRAAQEEMAAAFSGTGREIKIKGTGLSGAGAGVFFYKHLRESFRVNHFGLWGLGSLIMAVVAIGWAIIARPGYGADGIDMWLISLLGGMMLYKVLSMGYSRGILETYNHYIYMIPDRPFAKWFWANIETVFKAAVEGVVVFVAVGLILGTSFIATFAAMMAYIIFTFYLLGVNLASLRITDTNLNTGLLLVLYFAVVIIPLLPGVFAAIVVGMLASEALAVALAFLTLSGWMALIGVGCFALSKGALHNCDMPVMRERIK